MKSSKGLRGSARPVRGRLRTLGCLGAFLVSLLFALPALCQEPRRVDFRVTVSHVSSHPGKIDPRGKELHRVLSREIRYESLQVLEIRTLEIALDDIGSLKLPTGRAVRLRPLDIGPAGVLVAVDIEGSTRMDLRVPNHRIVVIGGQPYRDGKLVITLQPRY